MTEKSRKHRKLGRWIMIVISLVIIIPLLTLCCKCCSSGVESAAITEEAFPSTERMTSVESVLAMSEETSRIKDMTTLATDELTETYRTSLISSVDVTELETMEQVPQTLPEETTETADLSLEESTTVETETFTVKAPTNPPTSSSAKETAKMPSSSAQAVSTPTTQVPAPTTMAPAPTTTAATATPAHQHSYSGKVTKVATCGVSGVMTYTCSCGKSYTETIPATGNHTWAEQKTTVHHPTETHVVHHDAVTHTVHHDEVSHQEWIVDRPAYDEPITETHSFCNGCGKDLSVLEWETGTTPAEHSVWHIEHDGIGYGWHTEQVVIDVIHHEEVGHYKTVVDQPAWDETVVEQPAWDETVVDKEAWDEIVHDCYKCSVCGATKP